MTTFIRINILVLMLLINCIVCKGQSDTIVDSVKYNYVSHYDNGQIHDLGNFHTKGNKLLKQGPWIIYDQVGNIIEKGTYKRNRKIGIWYENGATGTYRNGEKNGNWYTYTELIIVYKHGKERARKYVLWQ
jgi:hypothetical protein